MNDIEKQQFYALFIQNGYVMDFSTYEFDEFTKASVGTPLCEKYGLSKGRSLKKFCSEETDDTVLKLFTDLFTHFETIFQPQTKTQQNQALIENCRKILEADRIKTLGKKTDQPLVPLSSGEFRIFSKKLRFIKNISSGSTGATYLFYDPSSDRKIVVKKLEPCTGEEDSVSFERFRNEANLLSQTCHPNIVRMYDSYMFPTQHKGFITMEYIEGDPIGSVSPSSMEKTWENLFIQTIEGFAHLESHSIVHRDIRENNILVTNTGVVKIIDFGFGKQITNDDNQSKSISLRRITSKKPEEELLENKYDIQTDIYYLGALFDTIIPEEDMGSFVYKDIVSKMKQRNPSNRYLSFFEIKEAISSNPESIKMFTKTEISTYRNISDTITTYIEEWMEEPVFLSDNEIVSKLEELSDSICLHEYIPHMKLLIRCLSPTGYSYRRMHHRASTADITALTQTLRRANSRKRSVLIQNLKTLLRTFKVKEKKTSDDDDIPF